MKKPGKECNTKCCHNKAKSRGLCLNCYQNCRNAVKAGKTTWEKLEALGISKSARGDSDIVKSLKEACGIGSTTTLTEAWGAASRGEPDPGPNAARALRNSLRLSTSADKPSPREQRKAALESEPSPEPLTGKSPVWKGLLSAAEPDKIRMSVKSDPDSYEFSPETRLLGEISGPEPSDSAKPSEHDDPPATCAPQSDGLGHDIEPFTGEPPEFQGLPLPWVPNGPLAGQPGGPPDPVEKTCSADPDAVYAPVYHPSDGGVMSNQVDPPEDPPEEFRCPNDCVSNCDTCEHSSCGGHCVDDPPEDETERAEDDAALGKALGHVRFPSAKDVEYFETPSGTSCRLKEEPPKYSDEQIAKQQRAAEEFDAANPAQPMPEQDSRTPEEMQRDFPDVEFIRVEPDSELMRLARNEKPVGIDGFVSPGTCKPPVESDPVELPAEEKAETPSGMELGIYESNAHYAKRAGVPEADVAAGKFDHLAVPPPLDAPPAEPSEDPSVSGYVSTPNEAGRSEPLENAPGMPGPAMSAFFDPPPTKDAHGQDPVEPSEADVAIAKTLGIIPPAEPTPLPWERTENQPGE